MQSAVALQARPRRPLLAVLAVSVAVGCTCAVAAGAIWLATGADFLFTFAVLRWLVVAALLATPVVWQLYGARQGMAMPYVVRTPLTALVLTCESIVVDILSARL